MHWRTSNASRAIGRASHAVLGKAVPASGRVGGHGADVEGDGGADGGADGGGGGTGSNALRQADSRIKSCDTSLTSISTTSKPAVPS